MVNNVVVILQTHSAKASRHHNIYLHEWCIGSRSNLDCYDAAYCRFDPQIEQNMCDPQTAVSLCFGVLLPYFGLKWRTHVQKRQDPMDLVPRLAAHYVSIIDCGVKC